MKELHFKISSREYQILELISLGHSTKEIALELSVSAETIKTHRYNLLKKLDAKNVAHLIRLAGDKRLFNSKSNLKVIPLGLTN
jgi:DNA-binding CsgD family transcriptional regulator